MSSSERCYLVREEALPQAIVAVARVKERLSAGKAGLAEALAEAGISRSTYYKYKDEVFAFHDLNDRETLNFTLSLGNETGVLSGVLGAVAEGGGNVLTIHQGLPELGSASVTLSVSMAGASVSAEELTARIAGVPGVLSVKLSGFRN